MADETPSVPPPGFPAVLWAAYAIAVRRLARSKFMWANIWFAFVPVLLSVIVAWNSRRNYDLAEGHEIFEVFLRTVYVGFVVFFTANVFGFAVVRQEFDGRTLHYLLLQPAPRWALFAGRYLAYLTIVLSFCTASLLTSYACLTLIRVPAPAVVEDLLRGGRALVLIKEAGVLAAGLATYGAVAMLAGSYFKSAMYTVLLLGWEASVAFLPVVLKKWTIIYYLQSLMPERPAAQAGMFELLGEFAGPVQCIFALLAVVVVALSAAAWRFQHRECQYAESS